jgi:hypothetical protein
MNVWFVAHEAAEWGINPMNGQREEVGRIPDVWDKLIYELDLTLRAEKRGPNRVAVVRKSRLLGFPDAEVFPLEFADFAERYGKDSIEGAVKALAQRLKDNHPHIDVRTGSNDPAGHDLVVNATPLGMHEGDPLPLDVTRLSPDTFVGEVVMRAETTAFLAAAQARGCRTQVGTDMLYEQIPAYLEFFGWPTTTADVLRRVAQLSY